MENKCKSCIETKCGGHAVKERCTCPCHTSPKEEAKKCPCGKYDYDLEHICSPEMNDFSISYEERCKKYSSKVSEWEEELLNLPDYPNKQNLPLVHRDVAFEFIRKTISSTEKRIANEAFWLGYEKGVNIQIEKIHLPIDLEKELQELIKSKYEN